MTALSDLFPDGPRTEVLGGAPMDDHHTVRRLREMIGEPRADRSSPRPLARTDELIRMADAAARNAAPVAVAAAEAPRPAKRTRARIDGVALTAGVLALVAVVAATTVGAVQMATASPAASSLEALQDDEAAIQNAQQSLMANRDRIVADVEAQTADAAELRAALVSTSTAPDPASAEGGLMVVTDEAALVTALAAVDAYSKGLASIELPDLPAEYSRGDIDTDSLVEVGSAIDAAQEQLVALDAATAELRALSTQVDALRPPVELAVTTYSATFAKTAEGANTRYPDAEEALRTALTDAAARVGSANLWEADGVAALQAYRDAFAAVAADQLRVEIERQQQREQEERDRQNQFQPDPEPTPPADGSAEPDPGTGTGDPGTVTPPGDETP